MTKNAWITTLITITAFSGGQKPLEIFYNVLNGKDWRPERSSEAADFWKCTKWKFFEPTLLTSDGNHLQEVLVNLKITQ